MLRQKRVRGLSLMETVVALSIFASLAILAVPTIGKAKRETRVVHCQGQLQEIGVAIIAYRNQNQGRSPSKLSDLVPQHINDPHVLICPFVSHVAPNAARQAEENSRSRGRVWASYFLYSQKGLDDLAARGKISFGFSDVLKRRGSDTPLVICRDHREPFSLNPTLSIGNAAQNTFPNPSVFPQWFFPEEPLIVLRYDGRVQKLNKGGTLTDRTAASTQQDLETL